MVTPPLCSYGSLSAWSHSVNGPWSHRRGFDSLIQHGTGFGYAEASAASPNKTFDGPKAMPCQALDHAAGFLFAFGLLAAVYRRASGEQVGSQKVEVSLVEVGLWLRGFGQRETEAFDRPGVRRDAVQRDGIVDAHGVKREWIKSAAMFGDEKKQFRWDRAPVGKDCDRPEWLPRS